MTDFAEWAKVLGVPGAFVAGLLLILWKAWVWSRDKIIEPVAKAHLGLVSTLQSNSDTQAHESVKMTKSVANIEEALAKIQNWPSDSNKICKAEEALIKAGFDRDKIDRILRKHVGVEANA